MTVTKLAIFALVSLIFLVIIKKLVDSKVFKKIVVLKGKNSPCEVAEVIEL